jgi:hypothetical protein
MSAQPDAQKAHSPIDAIAQWFRGWTRKSTASELKCMADEMVERMASDVGITAPELRALARLGPHSAELLRRRMTALDLDLGEVRRVEPAALQDLQRVCSLCAHHRRCAHDLAHDPGNPAWKHYCPNAETLTALNAEPWATPSEG